MIEAYLTVRLEIMGAIPCPAQSNRLSIKEDTDMPSIKVPKAEKDANAFVCPDCGERCKTYIAFAEHWIATHALNPTDVQCHLCQASVPRGDWVKHILTLHTEEISHA